MGLEAVLFQMFAEQAAKNLFSGKTKGDARKNLIAFLAKNSLSARKQTPDNINAMQDIIGSLSPEYKELTPEEKKQQWKEDKKEARKVAKERTLGVFPRIGASIADTIGHGIASAGDVVGDISSIPYTVLGGAAQGLTQTEGQRFLGGPNIAQGVQVAAQAIGQVPNKIASEAGNIAGKGISRFGADLKDYAAEKKHHENNYMVMRDTAGLNVTPSQANLLGRFASGDNQIIKNQQTANGGW